MRETLLSYFNLGNRYHGLEIGQRNGEYVYYLIKVKKKNEELLIEEQLTFHSWEEVLSQLDKSTPVFLAINTNDILTKPAEIKTVEGEALVNNIFPNINLKNVWFEIFNLNGQRFVSVLKKDIALQIVQKLKGSKAPIYTVGLGLSSLTMIIGQLYEEEIEVANYHITNISSKVQINKIHEKGPSGHTYDLNGLRIRNSQLLAFGAIVKGLIENEGDTNFEAFKKSGKMGFQNNRKFKLLLRFSIGLILVLLLINSIFYFYYSRKYNEILIETQGNEVISEVDSIKERVRAKEQIINSKSAFKTSKSSFYIDKLAESLLEEILLTNITYEDSVKFVSAKDVKRVNQQALQVEGTAVSPRLFSQWLDQLQKEEWVKNVKVNTFVNREKNLNHFELTLILDNAD